MITTGTAYMKAINDRIALNMAADETRGALASLRGAPETHMTIVAREYMRGALRCIEREAARIEAECAAWEGSAMAAREASSRVSLDMAFSADEGDEYPGADSQFGVGA